MSKNDDTTDPQLISYLTLRRAIGFIGILLPVLLGIGVLFGDDKTIQPSISDYYFTTMGDVFVGALFAVALFLFCYKGYDPIDAVTANLAGCFAIVVALFPTSVDSGFDCHMGLLIHTKITSIVHYSATALLFLTLAFFCLFLFRRTHSAGRQLKGKLQRNRFYLICGIIMICCVALIPLLAALSWLKNLAFGRATYILETIALWAFGVSWLVKGGNSIGRLQLIPKPASQHFANTNNKNNNN